MIKASKHLAFPLPINHWQVLHLVMNENTRNCGVNSGVEKEIKCNEDELNRFTMITAITDYR